MHLARLHAKGLKGLALFPEGGLTIDFDASVPAGVVSIVGPNGHGKTTFLELPIAALFGQFPSRLTPVPKLADFCTGKDAAIEVEIDVAGRGRYRARVSVDAVSGNVDGVLQLTTPEGDLQTLNDGKITTFRAAVARELPSLPELLASAFAAQNKAGSFAELNKRERKDLFMRLLGLDLYEARATTARAAAAAVEARLATLQELAARLQRDTAPSVGADITQTTAALKQDIAGAFIAANNAAANVADLEMRAAGWAQRAEQGLAAERDAATLDAQQQALRADLERLDQELVVAERERLRTLDALQAATAAQLARIAQQRNAIPTPASLDAALAEQLLLIDASLAELVRDKATRLANNRQLLETRDAVLAQARALDALDAQQRDLTERRAAALQADQDADEALRQAHARVNLDGRATDHVARQLAQARTAAALIDRVPFGDRCAEAGCEFVQQAVDARASIGALETAAADHAAAADQAQADLVAAMAAKAAAWATRQGIEREAAELAAALGSHQHTRVKAAALEQAAERVADLERDLAAADAAAARDRQAAHDQRRDAGETAQQQAADLDMQEREAIADEQLQAGVVGERASEAARDRDARQAAARAALAAAGERRQALIAALQEASQAREAQRAIEADLAAARYQLRTAELRQARLEEQAIALRERCERFQAQRRERADIEAAIDHWTREAIDWRILAKLLGVDGLPVLEIDAAGPGVSALANDLLRACFDGRFTVQLITQAAKADGKGLKEVFEIEVYDAERGADARDLATLSGGEQVVVGEAIKSAIALHLNQRQARPIETCWRDETIGALDPDAARRYMAMLRRVRERGGFRRIFVVSHNLDAAALADAQIRIAGGQLTVDLPPFAGEAVA